MSLKVIFYYLLIQWKKIFIQVSFREVLEELNDSYKKFCNLSGDMYKPYDYKVNVYTYEELLNKARNMVGDKIEKDLDNITKDLIDKGTDKRELPVNLIKHLLEQLQEKDPAIVLYFAAPYCPHNTLKKENLDEIELYKEIESIVSGFAKDYEEEYKIMRFFPSLSDSSYIKIDDDEESIDSLINNFPEYDLLYPVPLKKIKSLNIPALNYGCYGKDAHKWTERLYKPYSFNCLPKLILKTIDNYLL